LNFNKPIEMQAHPIDLAEVAHHVVALIAPQAEAAGIRIESSIVSPLWVNGDPALLQQAILNVVVNAMEAMSVGGPLRVSVGRMDGECQVQITDNGPGIPAELRERIFNLYFTTKQGGSGIGLAMTFRVVQLHSGTIDFSSELGEGTTFRLRFPELADYHGDARAASSHA
jgi:signal transduction histidine kinase